MIQNKWECCRDENNHFTNHVESHLTTLKELAQCSGILYRFKNQNNDWIIDHIPISLFPKYIQRDQIDDLKQKQRILQKLIDKMSKDYDYYLGVMKGMTKTDSFSRNMLRIAKLVLETPTASKYNFCFVRNDLMHHFETDTWYQVEYNCIAVSFAFISDKVQEYHQTLLNSYYSRFAKTIKIRADRNTQMMVDGILQCSNLYNVKGSKVLTVVSNDEGNIFDQRLFELELAKHGIQSIRATFEDMMVNLDRDTAYWDVREKIELSKAIKCPSLNIQIVNFKKFQEFIQREEELVKFISQEEATLLKQNFCQAWGFDQLEEQGQKIIEMIRKDEDRFVLKPQREGGGNNFYGANIVKELEECSPEKRMEYTLMARINPKAETGYLLKRGVLEIQQCISEIGIYGYLLSDGENLIKNEVGGYLVRTKVGIINNYYQAQQTDEGGVATGYAVIDSLAESE